MFFFGLKKISARQRLFVVLFASLCLPSPFANATPITGTAVSTETDLSPPEPLVTPSPASPSAALGSVRLPGISSLEANLSPDQILLDDLLGRTLETNVPPANNTALSFDTSPRSENQRPGDETLRQVLRSLATTSSIDAAAPAPSAFDPSLVQAPSNGKPSDPRRRGDRGILESRTAGRILREFVDVQAESDRSVIFSVMGMGNFVLRKSPRSGAVTLSELSSGWSATLLPRSDPYDHGASAGNGDPQTAAFENGGSSLLLAWNWLVDFVSSPLGIVVTMIAGVIAALAGIVRLGAFFRNQARQQRRNRRKRRRRSSRTRSRSRSVIR